MTAVATGKEVQIQTISKEELLDQLEVLKQSVIDRDVGLFGPDSMFWRVNRHLAMFLGAGRAALLQTAHPWVANAIDQHSKTKTDPMGRFRRTFTNVFTMVYGNMDQVLNSCITVHNIHATMFGQISEDSGAFDEGHNYQANEVYAMVWVHATLWETSIKMYELVVGPLTPAEKEAYYQETRLFAYCFGIPDSALPDNWNEFLEYNETMWNSDILKVEKDAEEIADFLFKFQPILQPALNHYKVITSMMMPERIREEYNLPPATRKNIDTYERFINVFSKSYRFIPDRFKYLPPYVEANRRLAGKHKPDFITAMMSKAMLGTPRLVSA